MSQQRNLWDIMRRHNVTQSELAARLGVTRETVSKVSKGSMTSRRVYEGIVRELDRLGYSAPKMRNKCTPLPACRYSPDITAGPWREFGDYTVNRYGLVRRRTDPRGPHGSLRKGDLLRPSFHDKGSECGAYTLHINGKRRWVPAHKLVLQAHKKKMIQVRGWRNKVLSLVDAQRESKKPQKAAPDRKRMDCSRGGARTRRCHDCGRPTNNYRCEKCWERIRSGLDCHTEDDFGCGVARPR